MTNKYNHIIYGTHTIFVTKDKFSYRIDKQGNGQLSNACPFLL